MASLGFVRNNPWVQQDKMRRDSQSEASNSACRPNGVVYGASQSLASSGPKPPSIRPDDEEPEYGPGIVRLLRDKFLLMAAEAGREAEAGRWKHSKARKAVSCESLLDGPVSLTASISQPAPTDLPASKYKLCGSTNALADVGLQAEEEEEGPPTPRAPSPMAPEEPVASIKARFEAAQSAAASPSPKKPLPKKSTMGTSEKEPEFLSAFKRLKPVAPPSDPKLIPEKLEPPSERIPTPLDSPLSLSSDISPPPEEPHPPTFSTTASLHIEPPSLPSPDLSSEPNELAVTAGEDVDDTDSESGLIGSYDITPAPSTDSVKPPPKECSEESDEAYPHSPAHSSDEQSSPPESGQSGPRAESPPVEARLALEAMADKLASSLVSPPINAAVQESLQVTIIDAVPQSLLHAQSIDRSAVEALLKEYRGVLPLVAEEDLPQLLAPEPASNPPPEFHDHNICLVPSQSSLKGEAKPAKGRVGFSSEAVGAYTYVAADDSSEDETEDGRDWSQGVHIDHLQYENLVLEHKIMKAEKKLAQVKARKEKEAEWASLNRWVEESTTAVSGGGAGPQLSSYVPAHLPSLEDSRSLAETEWDYRAGQSSQAEAANPLPQSFSRSNAAADLLF